MASVATNELAAFVDAVLINSTPLTVVELPTAVIADTSTLAEPPDEGVPVSSPVLPHDWKQVPVHTRAAPRASFFKNSSLSILCVLIDF
jgi:hypothetical protein